MNKDQRSAIFRRLQEANPQPRTELEYSTPFELLVAVLLSAQATDRSVNLATRKLFPVARTPEAILALGVDGLSEYIRTIGLYRSKARHLIETCRLLIEHHGSEVPQDRESLEALPGVGRKTANVVLNTAFGQPTMAVDTHIFRLARRWGLSRGTSVGAVEADLKRRFARARWNALHLQIIFFGREHCPARGHDFDACPICSWASTPTTRAADAKRP